MVPVEEGIKKCRDGTDRRRGVRKKTRAAGQPWEQTAGVAGQKRF